MCLKTLIRFLTSNENEPSPHSNDLEVCLCCLNYDYSVLDCILLMSSKWKCLSQEEVLFLPLVPRATLNTLIDMKPMFQETGKPQGLCHTDNWGWTHDGGLSDAGWKHSLISQHPWAQSLRDLPVTLRVGKSALSFPGFATE